MGTMQKNETWKNHFAQKDVTQRYVQFQPILGVYDLGRTWLSLSSMYHKTWLFPLPIPHSLLGHLSVMGDGEKNPGKNLIGNACIPWLGIMGMVFPGNYLKILLPFLTLGQPL
jgi:hypothetical protein